jgi:hypothetical protein
VNRFKRFHPAKLGFAAVNIHEFDIDAQRAVALSRFLAASSARPQPFAHSLVHVEHSRNAVAPAEALQ